MIEITKMEQCHVAGIVLLEQENFSLPWSENSIFSELSNPLSLWLVAMDENKVVGYVGSQSVMGEADMMNIAVSHDYRRQGIAEKLVSDLIKNLSDREVHCLTLEVRKSNLPAQKLYEKMGFGVIGCRPRYYEKPVEDAIILRKEWVK